MDNSEPDRAKPGEPVFPRSHRLIRRLSRLYAACVLAVGALLLAALLPASFVQSRLLAQELITGGLADLVLSALLLSLTGLLATLALTSARFRESTFVEGGPASALSTRWRSVLDHPGVAARVGQAIIVPVGAILIYLVIRLLWSSTTTATDSTAANVAASLVFVLAFISLVSERLMAGFPAPQLPEAPTLRRLLLLTTWLLVGGACIELGRAAMLGWVRWPLWVLTVLPILVALELALRALARLFLPAPAPANARAVTDSILAGVITGGPRSPRALARSHLGLDFARSWALSFLSAAVLPTLFGMALLCWVLTGLKLIDLGQRGIYERFGAPVAVLGPGLHLLMPWPLGRLRPVEFGTIHSVAIGVDKSAPDTAEQIAAEDTPPVSLNRLWESAHAAQADYLVPSPGTGQQGFQSVSTEIYVLYRVGLSDNDALQSVYSVANPESLIEQAGSRIVLRYFNSRTLPAVLGARRDNVEASLQDALAADMDSHHAGIQIVSVLIEEIHPPAGAAAAYHQVQAAEINARASIFDERGRAEQVAGKAQQEAHQLTDSAHATAVESVGAANAVAYKFDAERRAHADGGQAFLMERSFANLEAALSGKLLILVDHRLGSAPGPIFDLRSPGSTRPIAGDAVLSPSPNAQDAAQTPNAPSAPNTSAPDIESY
jgi:regulator of protease activity HflC (stomatin/prohibitin superfamily)